jgi:hypothetical protein
MRRRLAPPIVPLAVAILAAAASARAARAAEPGDATDDPYERYTLRAELGPEYDTNVHRTEIVTNGVNAPVVASPLARAVLSGTLSDLVTDGHAVALSATAATKIFTNADARNENVAIAESSALWRATLSSRAALTTSGAYYEASQRGSDDPATSSQRHDFRSLTPALRLDLAVSSHLEVGAGAGYRLFVFKPDPHFNFNAPTASLDLRWAGESSDGGADWEASLRTAFERRVFDGLVLVNGSPPVTGTATRVDNFLVSGLDLSRTGRVLIGGGYALHVNASNSFGSTAIRHFASARFATPLPLDFYLAAHAEVLVSAQYADDAVGRAFLSIEDENRSNARADLSRNLTDKIQLIARYTFYANPLGPSNATYHRHTALLSLSFTLEK